MILVTGATGFVGLGVIERLLKENYIVRGTVRREINQFTGKVDWIKIRDINPEIDWMDSLDGIDCIVHLAARVHVMNEKAAEPLVEFRRVNVDSTLNLARQAALAGVRRFVFVSSIKVNGEYTQIGRPFTAQDKPDPQDFYGMSKYEAEVGLLEIASKTAMEVVIIRPPLVYGPGVKANFASMMRWLIWRIPLPFGAVYNKRSMIALDNLVDLIVTCLYHPKAANQTFLVSDGEDMSIKEMLRRMGEALGKPAWLIPVPVRFMSIIAKLIRKEAIAQRLFESLQVDSSKTLEILGWKPVVTVDVALQKTADAFYASQKK